MSSQWVDILWTKKVYSHTKVCRQRLCVFELPCITVILCDCWQNYRWGMLVPERLLEIIWPKSFIFQTAKSRPRGGKVFYSTSYSKLMIVGTRTQASWFSVQVSRAHKDKPLSLSSLNVNPFTWMVKTVAQVLWKNETPQMRKRSPR